MVLKEYYDLGFKDGCAKGLNDAWECVKRILDMSWEERNKVFEYEGIFLSELIDETTPQEAIEKIKKYDEEFKIGDEIITSNLLKDEIGIVVKITDDFIYYCIKSEVMGAATGYIRKERCKKTGKKYPEFIKILNQLEENKGD